jgi:hypothetical protein
MQRWISGRLSLLVVVPGLLLVLSSASPAGAQDPSPTPPLVVPETPSLAEIARLEQMRRKTLKGASKVYTDKDLRRASPGQAAVPGSAAPSASSGSAAPPSSTPVPDAPAPAGGSADSKGKNDEATWKARMKQAREALRQNEVFAEALQTRINALTSDFVARDDPAQRAKIGEDRKKALAELDRVKSEIENAKKAIVDIDEDARKANVPPGWIR